SRDQRERSPRSRPNGASISNNGRRTTDNGHTDAITIRGASQHNLQAIDITVPRDQMSVFCGPSGSGKTSLAMDTLYAEGQRRYVESLSAYARQFLGQMPKPKVESVAGLSPAIAIEQKTVGATPRSTVGTVTEIYDYLRVLFARLGTPFCPEHDVQVVRQTTDEIVDRVLALEEGTRLYLAAPIEIPVGQSYTKLWDRLGTQGFLRVRINGETHTLEDVPEIDHKREHTVEAIIDRIKVDPDSRGRIADSIETALDVGKGVIHLIHTDRETPEPKWRVDRLSLHYSCPVCATEEGRVFENLTPQNFSFNSPLGWCDACEGLGVEWGTNQQALVANPNVSLLDGAVSAWPLPRENAQFRMFLEAIAAEFEIPLDIPWYQLDSKHQRIILYGSERPIRLATTNGSAPISFTYKGLYPAIDEATRISYDYRLSLQDLVGEAPCSVCGGDRVRDDAAAVRVNEMTLPHLCRLPLAETLEFLNSLKLDKEQKRVAGDLLNEAQHRLSFLVDVGLHYLTLDRGMPTLSGGESQRIRLAGQIGRALTGVLYVLDEPTIGLHPRDNGRLIDALHKLRNLGNTVVLVEHDREVIEASDRLYDFGPGSGRFGGNVVADGTPKQVARKGKTSLTGAYLSGAKDIIVPESRRMERAESGETRDKRQEPDNLDATQSSVPGTPYSVPPGGNWLTITGCRQNNLRGVDLSIPLGTLTCVTGLSGSGKSSLIQETLARAVARHLNRQGDAPGPFDEMTGVEEISRVINVDQAPLGATPASNPATYTGVFDPIRTLFSRLPEAKVRGYKPGRFSFNRQGGRCEDCEGFGQRKIEMHFLPDVWVTCDTCRGKRYNEETLTVRFKGHTISDVLELSIGQALELFGNIPKVRAPLATLGAIGLDYLTLGQSATTLSGGEAQRVKLAAELCKPNSGRTLYLLDEPTTGLHFDDIAKLLTVLNSLVEAGNTVVVIEHNLDVIKTADWIVDLGPEAGVDGGYIVAQGTPEDVVEYALSQETTDKSRNTNGRKNSQLSTLNSQPFRSWTGELLAPVLKESARGEVDVFDAKAAAKKQAGDVDIAKVGKDAPLPWKVDGRKWHTQERPARNGKPCKWEGAALASVVDFIEEFEGLKEANWGDPSTVEITAETKVGTGWFFHALTGDEWFVRLYFRVPKGSFDPDDVADSLDLTPVDDIDDIPVYGRGERVKFNNTKGPFQEVAIDVHSLDEIDTQEFRDFVETAIAEYVGQIEQQQQKDPNDLMPWKVLGRKWHTSRKGFAPNKRVAWAASMLETLLNVIEETMPNIVFDWGKKTIVTLQSTDGIPIGELQTKRRDGVILSLYTEPGQIALGQVSDLGIDPEITSHRNAQEAVKLMFKTLKQVKSPKLKKFLESLG
ncbi:MAG: excinuclease ABC subunit A, partial [Planctomycetaceae bacterium]|nr:excinuclease ABC subunit A [Planctomycetaceae bacterium]